MIATALLSLLLAAVAPFAGLHFRNIGPDIGRIDAVAGVPGTSTFFAGGLGGLWRTRNGAATWEPVFDGKPVSSIGAIAVAPSDPRVIYVGTGEPNLRNDIAFGDGVWRSRDGGSTWTHAGLDGTSQIAQIAIDPRNANVLYVAAIGDIFRSGSAQRGIFRSTDGGAHWTRVLHPDDATGASSIVINPRNPRVLLAGLWSVRRTPWSLQSGGDPNGGVYRSTDGGTHWTHLRGNGLPPGLTGRIGLAVAASDPARVYALIESRAGVLWRSDDGGVRWKLMSRNTELAQRPYYFSQLTVDPANANHVFFLSVFPAVTFDGGKTTKHFTTGLVADHHQLWIDPRNAQRMIVGADFGVAVSANNGKNWRRTHLLVSQAYHLAVSNEVPYSVCAELQDPGAACGPSLSFSGQIMPDQWTGPVSGESGWIAFDPRAPNVVYGTGSDGYVIRYDRRTMQSRVINPDPIEHSGEPASAAKIRGAWVAPLIASKFEPHAIYFGGNRLYKTTDDGSTWQAVSPDLTRNDPGKQRSSGGPITTDNAGTEYYDTISAIAESPRTARVLWVGTDDGRLWRTPDGGGHWTELTGGVPSLPEWARINAIAPSPFDEATTYVVVDAHKLGNRTPLVYVTHDTGTHWQSIAANLPRDVYARTICADPVRRGLLYLGTENGLWYSDDGGARWQRFQGNLPNMPVYDIVVQPQFDDLVIGTHGRSVWILDDLRPVQELTPAIAAQPAHLFSIRPAYRWSGQMGTFATYGSTEGAGENPQYGAAIDVYLQRKPAKGRAPKIEIYDGTRLIRTLTVDTATAGVNRVWWDLNEEPFKPPAILKSDTDGGFSGPTVAPGEYRVRLTGDGPMQTQPLTVLIDPRSDATVASIRAQNAFLVRIRADIERLANAAQALGKQHTPQAQRKLHMLYQPRLRVFRDDLRYPARLYEKLSGLASNAWGGDSAPTAADRAALSDLETQLDAIIGAH